jgi:hypothetical protein
MHIVLIDVIFDMDIRDFFFQVFMVANVATHLMYEIAHVVKTLCEVEVTW